jgi:hypothetical protein
MVFSIIQIILIICLNPIPESDSAAYLKSAMNVLESGNIYPHDIDFYSRWIAAPGWINFMALMIFLTGTYKCIYFVNVLLNLGILLQIKFFAESFISKSSGVLVVLIFTIQFSNYGMVLNMFTELIFAFLLLTAIRLYLKGGLTSIVMSGILVGLANSVRQFAPVIVVVFIISHLIYSGYYKRLIPWLFSIAITVLIIGFFNRLNSGYFVYSSITTGANMIAGSNPLSDGSYDVVALKEGGLGFIDNENELTVFQKDSMWKARSINWIVANPVEWLELVPKKLFYLYSCEISTLNHFRTESREGSFSNDFKQLAGHFPWLNSFETVLVLNNLIYLFVLSLSIFSIAIVIKNHYKPGYIAIIYVVIQTGVTLLAVGGDRYHYPMMPAFIFLTAYGLFTKLNKFSNYSVTAKEEGN